MRILFTILFLFGIAKGQNKDTVARIIPVMDSSHYWDIYRNDGRRLYHAVRYRIPPVNGWAIQLGLIDDTIHGIEGYEVLEVSDSVGGLKLVEILGKNYIQIGKPYIRIGLALPVNGYGFKKEWQ